MGWVRTLVCPPPLLEKVMGTSQTTTVVLGLLCLKHGYARPRSAWLAVRLEGVALTMRVASEQRGSRTGNELCFVGAIQARTSTCLPGKSQSVGVEGERG